MKQWFSSQRHEYVIIEGSIRETVFKISFECSPRGLVQRYEATLLELGVPDKHAVGSDVLKAQSDGLRYAQSGAGEQGK
jgi:hypothetical protein